MKEPVLEKTIKGIEKREAEEAKEAVKESKNEIKKDINRK